MTKINNKNKFGFIVIGFAVIMMLTLLLTIIPFNFNQTQVKAAGTPSANLIIGRVDNGNSINVSACLLATSGTFNLTDSSLWFGFDNSKLSTTSTFSRTGKYTGGGNYAPLDWKQVSPGPLPGSTADMWSLKTTYVGTGTSVPMTTVSGTSRELIGEVNFAKLDPAATGALITPNRVVYYSMEDNINQVAITVVNQTIPCDQNPSASSSSAAVTASSAANSTATSQAQSSVSSSPAISSSSATIVTTVPTITISSNILQIFEDAQLSLQTIQYADSALPKNTNVTLQITAYDGSLILYTVMTDSNGHINFNFSDLWSASAAFLNFGSLNVEAANSNIILVSGNNKLLNKAGIINIIAYANDQNGVKLVSQPLSVQIVDTKTPLQAVIGTVRTGGTPIFAGILLFQGLAYFMYTKKAKGALLGKSQIK